MKEEYLSMSETTDIPCREIKKHTPIKDLEGVTLEMNLRKTKWLFFGGYNHTKSNIGTFLCMLGPVLDAHMSRLENFIILGDFNCEIKEATMTDFSETYNLRNLVIGPTCFKNPLNRSSIDVMLIKAKAFKIPLLLKQDYQITIK